MDPKEFITYNLKNKGIAPNPILLIEEILHPIKNIAMIRTVNYNNNINNMDEKRLP
jgi:hypothetical protein